MQSNEHKPNLDAFVTHEITPKFIPQKPLKPLYVFYPDTNATVDFGNVLKPAQVHVQPRFSFDYEPGQLYAFLMVDPDTPMKKIFLHQAVLNVPGDNVDKGDNMAAYVGSGPPKGSGIHRYIFLVYKQGEKLKPEFNEPNNSVKNRIGFLFEDFLKKYKVDPVPVAGNFYRAEYDCSVLDLHKRLGFTPKSDQSCP